MSKRAKAALHVVLAPAEQDRTLAQFLAEYEDASVVLQQMLEDYTGNGYAAYARTLITAAGQITDKWILLTGMNDAPLPIAHIGCACHSPEERLLKTHALLAKWIPKGLMCIRQLRAALKHEPLPQRNVGDWAHAAMIAADKVFRYRERLNDLRPDMTALSAHRGDVVALMGRVARLRSVTEKDVPAASQPGSSASAS